MIFKHLVIKYNFQGGNYTGREVAAHRTENVYDYFFDYFSILELYDPMKDHVSTVPGNSTDKSVFRSRPRIFWPYRYGPEKCRPNSARPGGL